MLTFRQINKNLYKKTSKHFFSDSTTQTIQGTSKNSKFAQMQGVKKIAPRSICLICKQEIFFTTQQLR